MELEQRCFLTNAATPWAQVEFLSDERGYRVSSSLCGTYEVHTDLCGPEHYRPQLFSILQSKYRDRLHVLAGITLRESRDGRDLRLQAANVDDVLVSRRLPGGPFEQIDEILRFLYERESERPGEFVRLYSHPLARDLMYPVAFARDAAEFGWLLNRALELNYLDVDTLSGDGEVRGPDMPPRSVRLTIDGYKRVETLLVERDLKQAFVAMSFDDELDDVFHTGIKEALTDTGWEPLFHKGTQHNERIDDRIVADIKRSGLVIADFTLHRQNVYFEAGFAMGLGIPVIWTVRRQDQESVHFDTRQYNHVVWDTPEDLRVKLVDRIRASLPDQADATG